MPGNSPERRCLGADVIQFQRNLLNVESFADII